jgi:outer membrane autotransporter protein
MAFAVTGSYGQFDTSRTVSLPGFTGDASSSPVVESIDSRIRTAYNFVLDTWYARPYVDLDLIHTRAPGYNESGPATVSLNVATANQTTFVGTPAVEVGKRIDLQGGMTLRPFAMAGVSVYSNSDWKMQAAFSGAPIGSLPFTTTISEGSVVGRFGAGVQLLGYGNLDLRLQYDGEYGANRISTAGFLTAAWRF